MTPSHVLDFLIKVAAPSYLNERANELWRAGADPVAANAQAKYDAGQMDAAYRKAPKVDPRTLNNPSGANIKGIADPSSNTAPGTDLTGRISRVTGKPIADLYTRPSAPKSGVVPQALRQGPGSTYGATPGGPTTAETAQRDARNIANLDTVNARIATDAWSSPKQRAQQENDRKADELARNVALSQQQARERATAAKAPPSAPAAQQATTTTQATTPPAPQAPPPAAAPSTPINQIMAGSPPSADSQLFGVKPQQATLTPSPGIVPQAPSQPENWMQGSKAAVPPVPLTPPPNTNIGNPGGTMGKMTPSQPPAGSPPTSTGYQFNLNKPPVSGAASISKPPAAAKPMTAGLSTQRRVVGH